MLGAGWLLSKFCKDYITRHKPVPVEPNHADYKPEATRQEGEAGNELHTMVLNIRVQILSQPQLNSKLNVAKLQSCNVAMLKS